MRTRLPAALACLALWSAAAAAQESPPALDIGEVCASAGAAQPGLDKRTSVEGCERSEREARDTLKRRWSEFPAEAKRQCSRQAEAGGSPSHVETLTCLELASGVPTLPPGNQPKEAEQAPARPAGSRLTEEPSPRQRTNPIEVLENKGR